MKFWGGTTLFLFLSWLHWRANMEIFRGICRPCQGKSGFICHCLVCSVRPFSSDILYLAWDRIPSICCPPIGWDMDVLDVLAHASKQKALRSSHRLCSGPALCDMLCGRLSLWQGVTRAVERALTLIRSPIHCARIQRMSCGNLHLARDDPCTWQDLVDLLACLTCAPNYKC